MLNTDTPSYTVPDTLTIISEEEMNRRLGWGTDSDRGHFWWTPEGTGPCRLSIRRNGIDKMPGTLYCTAPGGQCRIVAENITEAEVDAIVDPILAGNPIGGVRAPLQAVIDAL